MKVLMTADTVGGVWTYAVELMKVLQRRGVHFLLATMGRKLSPEQWADVRALSNVEVAESSYRLEWMPDSWEDVAASGDWLISLEKRFQPDVVHLNGYAHGNLPFTAKVLVVGHSCVLSWWQAVNKESAPASEWQQYAEAVRQGLHTSDLVAAPTEAMLSALDSHYGPLPKERLVVLPNCRDPRMFFADGHGTKEPFVFSAGRLWDKAKNVRTLCDAATSHCLPWSVVVAGETEEPGQNVNKLEIPSTEKVRFLGPLSTGDMANIMRRAAIYALPVRYEPFGLSVLEAALSGCALVLGDVASLREVWGDSSALYVSPDDSAALAAAITCLAENAPLRKRLAANALLRACTLYTPERTANAYLQAYGIK